MKFDDCADTVTATAAIVVAAVDVEFPGTFKAQSKFQNWESNCVIVTCLQ